MGRYVGDLGTDAYKISVPELKTGVIDFGKPVAADADGLLEDAQSSATDPVVVTEFLAELDLPRKLSFTPSASAAAGNILVEGTDIADTPITDTIATSTTTAVVSAKAFKTVTKITFPADASAITWDVGWGKQLGLPFKLAAVPERLEFSAGALKTTAGTFSVDEDVLAKNTYDPNGTLNGTNTLRLILFL